MTIDDHSSLSNGSKPQWLNLTEALLEALRGRMSLLQPDEERRTLVLSALQDLYKKAENGVFPDLSSQQKQAEAVSQFLSYDLIEKLLEDPLVEDIIINALEPIHVHKTGSGLVKTNQRFATNRELLLFVKKLLVFASRTEFEPINDLELADIRGRVNIAQSPYGPQITITRGKTQPLTILQLVESGMFSYELAGQFWLYVEGLRVRPGNIIISGGPGSGKTTLLNAFLSFIPPRERLVIIEDTLELNTQFLENCSRLESCRRVKTSALVKNSLRMRPERILIGEVRGEEARDLMTGMNLGKFCMGTMHASTARESILRLENEPMCVPPILITMVDVFIVLRKLNHNGKIARMVSEVAETGGINENKVLLASLWLYEPDVNKTVQCSPSTILRDRLAAESCRTTSQIMEEAARRGKILEAMHQSKRFQDIASVTQFCQLYSDDPSKAERQLKEGCRIPSES